LSDSYVGITAATGQLSDNHDVLSLVTYEDEKTLDKTEQKKRTIKEEKFQIGPDVKMDDRLGRNFIYVYIYVCIYILK
jgi:hypothetical protein